MFSVLCAPACSHPSGRCSAAAACVCSRSTRVLLLSPLYRLTRHVGMIMNRSCRWCDKCRTGGLWTVCFCQNSCSQLSPGIIDGCTTRGQRLSQSWMQPDSGRFILGCIRFSAYRFRRKDHCVLNLYPERSTRLTIYTKSQQVNIVLLDSTSFLTPKV